MHMTMSEFEGQKDKNDGFIITPLGKMWNVAPTQVIFEERRSDNATPRSQSFSVKGKSYDKQFQLLKNKPSND